MHGLALVACQLQHVHMQCTGHAIRKSTNVWTPSQTKQGIVSTRSCFATLSSLMLSGAFACSGCTAHAPINIHLSVLTYLLSVAAMSGNCRIWTVEFEITCICLMSGHGLVHHFVYTLSWCTFHPIGGKPLDTTSYLTSPTIMYSTATLAFSYLSHSSSGLYL